MKKYIIFLLFTMIISLIGACSTYDSNDGKCDGCGDTAYSKLSDGNEYCRKCYKEAINYYLDN
ncbi:MAG: hypothetical protein IKT52_13165 [Oscillospiraceae bacterium]|nr:hypothetical protein [Oscillospiraceae bacterium]